MALTIRHPVNLEGEQHGLHPGDSAPGGLVRLLDEIVSGGAWKASAILGKATAQLIPSFLPRSP